MYKSIMALMGRGHCSARISDVIQLIQVTWYMVDANSREREIKVMPAWKWMCNKMKNDSLIYQELLDINGK